MTFLKLSILTAIFIAVSAATATAQQNYATRNPWPTDVKAAIQGEFFARSSRAVVEVVGDQIILRERSQYPDQPEAKLPIDRHFFQIENIEPRNAYGATLRGPLAGEDRPDRTLPNRTVGLQRAGHDGSLVLRIFGREFAREADLNEYDLADRVKPYPR